MNTEFSSIFYESRDDAKEMERAKRLGRQSKADFDKYNKASDFVYNNMSDKDKQRTDRADRHMEKGNMDDKDIKQAARFSNAVHSKVKHDKRHPQKECGLMNYDLI